LARNLNKFLKLKSEVKVELDKNKIEEDKKFAI
jgi:hypothetical protein